MTARVIHFPSITTGFSAKITAALQSANWAALTEMFAAGLPCTTSADDLSLFEAVLQAHLLSSSPVWAAAGQMPPLPSKLLDAMRPSLPAAALSPHRPGTAVVLCAYYGQWAFAHHLLAAGFEPECAESSALHALIDGRWRRSQHLRDPCLDADASSLTKELIRSGASVSAVRWEPQVSDRLLTPAGMAVWADDRSVLPILPFPTPSPLCADLVEMCLVLPRPECLAILAAHVPMPPSTFSNALTAGSPLSVFAVLPMQAWPPWTDALNQALAAERRDVFDWMLVNRNPDHPDGSPAGLNVISLFGR